MKKSTYNFMKMIPGLSGIADLITGSRFMRLETLRGTKGEYLIRLFCKLHPNDVMTYSQYNNLFESFNKCNYGVKLGDPMDEAFKEIAKKFFKK